MRGARAQSEQAQARVRTCDIRETALHQDQLRRLHYQPETTRQAESLLKEKRETPGGMKPEGFQGDEAEEMMWRVGKRGSYRANP